MEDFKDLRVWENPYELTLGVYKATRSFPKEEMYGLTSQLRRALHQLEQISQKDVGEGQIRR